MVKTQGSVTNSNEAEQMHKSGHFMIKILTATTGFMAVLISSALIWGASTLNSMQVSVGVLQSQIKTFSDQVMYLREELKDGTRNRYTSEHAANDRKLIDMEIKMIHSRLDSVSERIETIKDNK